MENRQLFPSLAWRRAESEHDNSPGIETLWQLLFPLLACSASRASLGKLVALEETADYFWFQFELDRGEELLLLPTLSTSIT